MSLLSLCQKFCALSVQQLRQVPTKVLNTQRSLHHLVSQTVSKPTLLDASKTVSLNTQWTRNKSLMQLIRKGPYWRKKKSKSSHLDGKPAMRGVVLRVMVKKPKKPNSANRKCVRLKLSNGVERTAYIPGEGHNLQEHSIVLVEGGRLQDVPGVKLRCVRGKYDLARVKKK